MYGLSPTLPSLALELSFVSLAHSFARCLVDRRSLQVASGVEVQQVEAVQLHLRNCIFACPHIRVLVGVNTCGNNPHGDGCAQRQSPSRTPMADRVPPEHPGRSRDQDGGAPSSIIAVVVVDGDGVNRVVSARPSEKTSRRFSEGASFVRHEPTPGCGLRSSVQFDAKVTPLLVCAHGSLSLLSTLLQLR